MRNRTTARRLTSWLTPRLGLEALEGRVNPVVVPVTPTSLAASGWQLTASDGNPAAPPPSAVFEAGPATPPAGGGSLEFRISPLGDDAAQARLTTLGGTLLSDLTAVSYSTYVDQNNGGLPGNGGQAPYLIVSVDYDNNGTSDDLLFFEPLYQDAAFFPSNPQSTLVLDTWQTWDALNGGWYSVNGTAGSGPGANVKPLSTFFTPALGGDADATIVNTAGGLGGFRVVTGFGGLADWANFIGNVDAVTIDTAAAAPVTTYDFGLDLPATVYVDDTFATPVPGQDPDGAGPATSFGYDAFATIQEGVNAVAPGGTVNVRDGIYAESNIQVGKPVTIQGQSEAGVLVVPDVLDVNEDSSFGGAFRHAFVVQSDGVTIQTLTIDGDLLNAGVYGYRTGIITDFFFTPGPYDGLTVQDVAVNDVYRRGVQLSDVSTGNLIAGVTVDDVGLATEEGIGIASFSGAGTISNNTVTNAFTGIAVNFAFPNTGVAPTLVTIQGNDVTVRNVTAGAGGIGLSLYGLLGGSVVSGNTITLTTEADADTGILFADARGGPTTISGNTILASGGDLGIIVSETSVAAAPVITGNTLTATGSTAGGVGEGVAILLTDDFDLTASAGGDTFATISSNTITGFVTGIQLLDRATAPADTTTVNATITGQTLTGLTNGLLATGGGGTLSLSGVTITNNTGVGLSATGFDGVSISGLTLTGNGGTQSVATTPGGTIDFVATTGATPFTITASGTQLVADPTGGTANQPIALSGQADLNVTGGSGADTFNITPPATGTTITVTGGLPTTLPGDVLDLDFTGASGSTLTTTGSPTGFSGSYTFTNRGAVAFTGIESLADAATVRGRVYNDTDRDGTADAGEGGVVGVPVRLDLDADGTVDQTATTDALGNYSFATLAPGMYRVSVDTVALPPGTTVVPAAQQTITVADGATTTADFGVQSPTGTTAGTTVTGVVFNDANQNRVRETGEVGVNGLTVFLDLDNDGRLDPNEPSALSATVNGQAGSFTLFTTQGGTVAGVRVVEQPGFVTNTTATAVVLNGTTQTVDVGVFANIPTQTPPSRQFAVAGTVAGRTTVRVYNPNGTPAYEIPGGTGDLRVAVGDVTGDGVEDVVIGSGIGAASLVRVIDGATRQQVASFSPFEASFIGGVYVTLGDLTGDGVRDVVVTPDQGGGPRVVVYRGGAAGAFTQVASFLGIQDPAFRGGARAAVGDVNADGRPDLAVAAGFLGGPRVAVYDGPTVLSGTPTRLVNDFFAFEDTLRNGAYVAVGDLNGDGFGDLVFGAGPGGAPRVLAVSGQALLTQGSTAALAAPLANFFGGDPANRAGIRVAVKDLDGDGRADFLTGGGSGTTVAAYDGQDLTVLFTLSSGSDPLGAFNGVFVG